MTPRPFVYALLPSLWPDGVDAQTLLKWSEEQLTKFRHVHVHKPKYESVVIVHLQSERGRQLNGQRGKLVGGDPPGSPTDEWRLHVRLDASAEGDKPLRVKPVNVLKATFYSSAPSQSWLSDERVRGYIGEVVEAFDYLLCHHILDGLDHFPREDVMERLNSLRSWRPGDVWPCACSATAEGVVSLKCQARMDPIQRIMSDLMDRTRGGCHGDGFVRLERLAEGLVSLGGETCAVCLEELEAHAELLLLPCGHAFHPGCGRESLAHKRVCPVCRSEVVSDDLAPTLEHNFLKPIAGRIRDRFTEFITSGYCERCQLAHVEGEQFRQARRAKSAAGESLSAWSTGAGNSQAAPPAGSIADVLAFSSEEEGLLLDPECQRLLVASINDPDGGLKALRAALPDPVLVRKLCRMAQLGLWGNKVPQPVEDDAAAAGGPVDDAVE